MAHTRYSFEEGIRAQTALRRAAHLPPESFSIEGFVSSVREEIDTLRGMGLCDDQIAEIVRQHSSIYITGNEVSVHSSPRHESRPRVSAIIFFGSSPVSSSGQGLAASQTSPLLDGQDPELVIDSVGGLTDMPAKNVRAVMNP